MYVPPQAVYLYFGCWTMELDEIVLNTINKLKMETQWKFDVFPDWYYEKAQHAVQTKTNTTLTNVDIKLRLDFLKKRYTTFNAVTKNKGASYDVEAKVVRASDMIWEAILNKTPFAATYYHRDYPHFTLLECLYEMEDDNGEREVEIIVLSETEEISTDEPSCYEVSGFEAEVNSAPYTRGHDQY
ncbi:hypothetical protein SASPL_145239 [Salvia splendens]|uniref:Myb/SANT-like domain-containing protein n=1 Tax=Salvia splendens TaxID=180675 RepID=A0A8X8WG71_SALSN|nr:hypothetical protein SASPL_145239 [Salvia splendens]